MRDGITATVAVAVGKPGEDLIDWVGVVAFGTAAEMLAGHQKGDVISAMGQLTRSTFPAETAPSARRGAS
jgi:hypothetical protein